MQLRDHRICNLAEMTSPLGIRTIHFPVNAIGDRRVCYKEWPIARLSIKDRIRYWILPIMINISKEEFCLCFLSSK